MQHVVHAAKEGTKASTIGLRQSAVVQEDTTPGGVSAVKQQTRPIPTVISNRSDSQTRYTQSGTHRSSSHNVILVNSGGNWDLPKFLNCNARSLGIEKLDELQAVVEVNDVSVACITETLFRNFTPNESIDLDGFTCERRYRQVQRGGGVAYYVKHGLCYDRLADIESSEYEVIWLKVKPKRLPRSISCIVMACVYHPLGKTTRVYV